MVANVRRLLKHCNKDEMTQSGNIIQYLSANFAGMVDDKWPQRSNTLNPAVCWGCLCKRQRYPLPHPQNSLIITLQEKPFNNINQSLKKKGQNAQFSFPVKIYMKCKDCFFIMSLCLLSLPPAVHVTSSVFFWGFDCGPGPVWQSWWSVVLIGSGDIVQVHWIVQGGWKQVSLCVRQSCVCVVKFSVRRVLGRTGGTVGRAGVRWSAGLLLVLRGAIRLQRRHGRWRVFALGRAAFAAEQLAFDFPEVVAIVKS